MYIYNHDILLCVYLIHNREDSTEIHSLDELRSSSDSERSSKKVRASRFVMIYRDF